MDKIGRKPLLLIGAAGMVLTLGTMAWCFSTATQTTNAAGETVTTLDPTIGKVALAAANLYVVSFGMSWGPVLWVLLGEMFNNAIRVTALAVAASAQWIANWIISTSFPTLSNIGLSFAYGIYCTFALLAFIFVWRAVRETKGRELEQMKRRRTDRRYGLGNAVGWRIAPIVGRPHTSHTTRRAPMSQCRPEPRAEPPCRPLPGPTSGCRPISHWCC